MKYQQKGELYHGNLVTISWYLYFLLFLYTLLYHNSYSHHLTFVLLLECPNLLSFFQSCFSLIHLPCYFQNSLSKTQISSYYYRGYFQVGRETSSPSLYTFSVLPLSPSMSTILNYLNLHPKNVIFAVSVTLYVTLQLPELLFPPFHYLLHGLYEFLLSQLKYLLCKDPLDSPEQNNHPFLFSLYFFILYCFIATLHCTQLIKYFLLDGRACVIFVLPLLVLSIVGHVVATQ